MEKAFTDLPGPKHSGYSLESDLAVLESVRQSRKQRRCRWISYLLVVLCTAFVVIGSAKAYDCWIRAGSHSTDSSNDVSIMKGHKQEGFVLYGYKGDEGCGGKDRTVINKGSTFEPACLYTDVEYDSLRIYNGQKSAYFGVCLYSDDTCAEGSALTKAPLKDCASHNNTEVKGYRVTYGVLGGLCP